MPLAYYRYPSAEDYWSDVWRAQSLERLLEVAARDPLSKKLEDHLPAQGLILEAGCGLGQYVVFFRQRGYPAIGVDRSLSALRTHRQAYPESPLLGLDLHHMPLADATCQCLISLGVVEHLEAGPQRMLGEFFRTVAPGGTLLLSVPWANVYRRLARPFIRRSQAKLRAHGAAFYQYAFTRQEAQALLEEAGFRVVAFHAYSPARGMREFPLLTTLYRRAVTSSLAGGVGAPAATAHSAHEVSGMRRLLYWPPVLWAFAHMTLAVARKPES